MLAQKSLSIAQAIGALDNQGYAYSVLADVYDSLGKTKESYKYYKQFIAIQDSMFNAEKHKQLSEMESKYEGEKKQKEIELQNTQLAKSKAEIKQQSTQKYAFILGFTLMLLLSLVVYISYRNKRKANIVLHQQKAEIITQRDEIQCQRDLVTAQKQNGSGPVGSNP